MCDVCQFLLCVLMIFFADDELEEKIVAENYKIWRKNVPYLYDYMIAQAFEWPSITVQWLPDKIMCVLLLIIDEMTNLKLILFQIKWKGSHGASSTVGNQYK